MNIKGLLLGSAAAMVAVSGARAADAIVIPEPEPVEYVRICDVYGAGYFYIPGTETCLQISGYYRVELRHYPLNRRTFTGQSYDPATNTVTPYGITLVNSDGYTTFARFAPWFRAKSETELGTLSGEARVYFQWGWADAAGPAAFNVGPVPASGSLLGGGYATATVLDHMFISLTNSAGVLRLGKGDTPYARFLGYGGPTINDGNYGYNNSFEMSYQFNGGNGFSAIIALVEDGDTNWIPDVEGGASITQGWGSFGVMAGYDESASSWGGKAVLRVNVPNTPVSLSLHGFYSGTGGAAGTYTISDAGGGRSEFSVLGGVSVALSPMIGVATTVQYFDTGNWYAAVGLPISPVENLTITPEVLYTSNGAADGGAQWTGLIRFQRSF